MNIDQSGRNTSKNKEKLKACGIAAVCAVLGIVLDQVTKYLAVTHLKGADPTVLIDGVLQLEYLENRGAAFGLFQNMQWIFMIFSLMIAALVIFVYWRIPVGKRPAGERSFLPLRICAVLLLAGAIGNCIDRIRLGYVVDFIYFKLIDFPIFNVADMFVTVSVAFLIILLLFYYKEEDLNLLFPGGSGKEKEQKQEE